MTPAPKRRWFRWSLRTMFVVALLVACGFGYPLNWIRQRHALIEAPERTGVEAEYGVAIVPMSLRATARVETNAAPWPLRWLGERGVSTLYVRDDMPDPEVARIRALFPEAEIERVSPDFIGGDEI
jgi:hypothetical protein